MTNRQPFQLEEATIDQLHDAIKAGDITCVEVVQRYIDRARAYNGVCSMLVTADGAPIPESQGTVRAGEALRFPYADGASIRVPARLGQVRRAAPGVRAYGAHGVGSPRWSSSSV